MSNITFKAASNCLRNSFETHGLLHVILTDNEHLLVRDESCKPFDMSFVSYLHYVETILACLTYHMRLKKLTCHTDLPAKKLTCHTYLTHFLCQKIWCEIHGKQRKSKRLCGKERHDMAWIKALSVMK